GGAGASGWDRPRPAHRRGFRTWVPARRPDPPVPGRPGKQPKPPRAPGGGRGFSIQGSTSRSLMKKFEGGWGTAEGGRSRGGRAAPIPTWLKCSRGTIRVRSPRLYRSAADRERPGDAPPPEGQSERGGRTGMEKGRANEPRPGGRGSR